MTNRQSEQELVNVLNIAVGSTNPAKLHAVEKAINICINRQDHLQRQQQCDTVIKINVVGFTVPSGVPEQPFGDIDTCCGAKNRAKAAYDEYVSKYQIEPHLAIGMEGGLEYNSSSSTASPTIYCMAWMAVYGKLEKNILDVFAETTRNSSSVVTDTTTSDNNDIYRSHQQYNQLLPIYGIAKSACFPLPKVFSSYILQDGMELGKVDDIVFSRQNSKQGQGTIGKLTNNFIDRSTYYEHAIIIALIPWMNPKLYPNGIV
jgi:inosine/xanthosine triphosphatase